MKARSLGKQHPTEATGTNQLIRLSERLFLFPIWVTPGTAAAGAGYCRMWSSARSGLRGAVSASNGLGLYRMHRKRPRASQSRMPVKYFRMCDKEWSALADDFRTFMEPKGVA